MKGYSQCQIFTVLVFLLMLSGYKARAYHENFIGNEITYEQTGANTFQVYLIIYQGCNVPQPTSQILNIKAPGCNNGRSFNVYLQSSRLAAPNCSRTLNNCTPGQMNYRELKYTATVTFTPAEMACPDWVLSWSLSTSRYATQNMASALDFYGEAR